MHRRKFRLTPSVLAIPLFLCSFAGIVTAGAEERMHGLEIFRSGNIVITSSAIEHLCTTDGADRGWWSMPIRRIESRLTGTERV